MRQACSPRRESTISAYLGSRPAGDLLYSRDCGRCPRSKERRRMSEFKRAAPKSPRELSENFQTLLKNKNHVKKVEVNLTTGHLEITLDWLAHAKVADFYIPLKRGKITDAKQLVERMLHEMDGGFSPSESEIG